MTYLKCYEIELNSCGQVSLYTCVAPCIEEAVKEAGHFRWADVVSIREISEKRYMGIKIAKRIKNKKNWYESRSDCAMLCEIAGIKDEWKMCNGDRLKETVVTCKAANVLKVSI